MVAEMPREKLKELVEKNGDTLLLDRDRCEGLLKDHCGAHRREISAIVGALEERIPLELKSSWQTAMTPEAMRARLVQRLEDNRGLAPEIADWAVDTWSYALGVGLGRKSDRVEALPGDERQLRGTRIEDPIAAKVAGDRPGGLRGDLAENDRGGTAGAVAALQALSPKKKASVGGLALLVAAGIAIALIHHPNPPVSIPPQNPPAADNDPSKVQPGRTILKPGPGITSGTTPGSALGSAEGMIAAGTPIEVRLNHAISSDELSLGDVLPATVVMPLTLNGNVLVPQGSTAQLKVTGLDATGKQTGRAKVELALVSITANGKHLAVSAADKTFQGMAKSAHMAERGGIGAAGGGVVGFLTGKLFHHGGAGAAAGAAAGGAAGVATTKPSPAKVSATTVIQFQLTRALGVKS